MSGEHVDPATGEVREGSPIGMVPLDLAGLSEEELLQRIPTPQQCAMALMMAREALTRAPAVLRERSAAVKAARRQLVVAIGFATQRASGASVEERRRIAMADPEVIAAGEELDTAELALEYAREWRKSLDGDVDILRSLNANFRKEYR